MQSLQRLPRYNGEVEGELFEDWLQQLEEYALLAGWPDESRCFHLKMSLTHFARRTYDLLPKATLKSYSATVVF